VPGVRQHATPPDQALVPPTVSARSNKPTCAPSAAARTAAVDPAAPVPNTTTSYWTLRAFSCIKAAPDLASLSW